MIMFTVRVLNLQLDSGETLAKGTVQQQGHQEETVDES